MKKLSLYFQGMYKGIYTMGLFFNSFDYCICHIFRVHIFAIWTRLGEFERAEFRDVLITMPYIEVEIFRED